MLIRSQDKTALVKFENVVINLKLPDKVEVICWSLQDTHRNGGYLTLGNYSTNEKALKVLDMIQEAYTNEKAVEMLAYCFKDVPSEVADVSNAIINKLLSNGVVFEMPADEDVKV